MVLVRDAYRLFSEPQKSRIGGLSFGGGNIDPPPLSRPLRGKLGLYLPNLSHWFTGPEVEYEELALGVTGIYSQVIIAACGKTLKRLKFGYGECITPLAMVRNSLIRLKWISLQASSIIQNFAGWDYSRYSQHRCTKLQSPPSPP